MAEGQVKKVGGSYAIFLPIEEAKRLQLKEGEKVSVVVGRRISPRLWGICKDTGISTPRFRRMLEEADRGE